METPDESLAPWAHPKAQEWLTLILRKSDLVDSLAALIESPAEPLDMGQQRVLTMLLVVLGHPGVWPEEKRELFTRCATRLHSYARQTREEAKLNLKAVEQKTATVVNADWDVELEMLRRRGGISKRVNALALPATWKRFWN
jgi:hypothetical protein